MKPCKNLLIVFFLLGLPLLIFAQTEIDSVHLQGPAFADTTWHFQWQIFPPQPNNQYTCTLMYYDEGQQEHWLPVPANLVSYQSENDGGEGSLNTSTLEEASSMLLRVEILPAQTREAVPSDSILCTFDHTAPQIQALQLSQHFFSPAMEDSLLLILQASDALSGLGGVSVTDINNQCEFIPEPYPLHGATSINRTIGFKILQNNQTYYNTTLAISVHDSAGATTTQTVPIDFDFVFPSGNIAIFDAESGSDQFLFGDEVRLTVNNINEGTTRYYARITPLDSTLIYNIEESQFSLLEGNSIDDTLTVQNPNNIVTVYCVLLDEFNHRTLLTDQLEVPSDVYFTSVWDSLDQTDTEYVGTPGTIGFTIERPQQSDIDEVVFYDRYEDGEYYTTLALDPESSQTTFYYTFTEMPNSEHTLTIYDPSNMDEAADNWTMTWDTTTPVLTSIALLDTTAHISQHNAPAANFSLLQEYWTNDHHIAIALVGSDNLMLHGLQAYSIFDTSATTAYNETDTLFLINNPSVNFQYLFPLPDSLFWANEMHYASELIIEDTLFDRGENFVETSLTIHIDRDAFPASATNCVLLNSEHQAQPNTYVDSIYVGLNTTGFLFGRDYTALRYFISETQVAPNTISPSSYNEISLQNNTEAKVPLSNDNEGFYYVYFVIRDAAGNLSDPIIKSIEYIEMPHVNVLDVDDQTPLHSESLPYDAENLVAYTTTNTIAVHYTANFLTGTMLETEIFDFTHNTEDNIVRFTTASFAENTINYTWQAATQTELARVLGLRTRVAGTQTFGPVVYVQVLYDIEQPHITNFVLQGSTDDFDYTSGTDITLQLAANNQDDAGNTGFWKVQFAQDLNFTNNVREFDLLANASWLTLDQEFPYNLVLNANPDGMYTVYCRLLDKSGNTAEQQDAIEYITVTPDSYVESIAPDTGFYYLDGTDTLSIEFNQSIGPISGTWAELIQIRNLYDIHDADSLYTLPQHDNKKIRLDIPFIGKQAGLYEVTIQMGATENLDGEPNVLPQDYTYRFFSYATANDTLAQDYSITYTLATDSTGSMQLETNFTIPPNGEDMVVQFVPVDSLILQFHSEEEWTLNTESVYEINCLTQPNQSGPAYPCTFRYLLGNADAYARTFYIYKNAYWIITDQPFNQDNEVGGNGHFNHIYALATQHVQEKLETFYNYPNPFNPINEETIIRVALLNEDDITLKIYDVFGNLVRDLSQPCVQGVNRIVWDGKNGQGETIANGSYIAFLQANGITEKRIIAVKK